MRVAFFIFLFGVYLGSYGQNIFVGSSTDKNPFIRQNEALFNALEQAYFFENDPSSVTNFSLRKSQEKLNSVKEIKSKGKIFFKIKEYVLSSDNSLSVIIETLDASEDDGLSYALDSAIGYDKEENQIKKDSYVEFCGCYETPYKSESRTIISKIENEKLKTFSIEAETEVIK